MHSFKTVIRGKLRISHVRLIFVFVRTLASYHLETTQYKFGIYSSTAHNMRPEVNFFLIRKILNLNNSIRNSTMLKFNPFPCFHNPSLPLWYNIVYSSIVRVVLQLNAAKQYRFLSLGIQCVGRVRFKKREFLFLLSFANRWIQNRSNYSVHRCIANWTRKNLKQCLRSHPITSLKNDWGPKRLTFLFPVRD